MIEFMSVEELAQKLGIKTKTIHNWVHMRKIPYTKIGRKVMFNPRSIETWLSRREVQPDKIWEKAS